VVTAAHCPDCGTELGSGAAPEGLCPRCLLSLALVRSPPDSDATADSEAPTLDRPTAGEILGERYQMRELLGRGGMGEVWRAFDLKLRVDVALKSVRAERLASERAHELLRQEVRSAREVVSPNVCRIFDLIVEEGRELVSMEYIDGTTLTETLRSRGPLELKDAREIASQFLAGLDAIHQAGLVHRDFKPENVMLTRAGRVVVMDFGLAKGLEEAKTGSIAGTPAYMAPEQARGETLDARADVYAAGVVLAEMLAVGGTGAIEARQALWKAVREAPPQVPEGPWAPVLRQALEPIPDARPTSARALARALDEVTLRLPGFEEKRPYPGLASFTEEDAEYFFGREAEVEALWKKLKRPRLLALIGPSGTGKSSFVRAGLLATLPPGWAAIVATPGHRPAQSLAQALVPAFSGDTGVMQEFLRFDDPETAVSLVSRWRRRHEHALIVVDQFEELFTLNPPEVQAAFAQLLGRLVLDADAHVLLSMRDDFLIHCQAHEPLGPAFADLTPLGPLGDAGLRRALVQPALACGYRFEDEALVDEMAEEVGQERGALPLLAFAASRLWEERDREQGLLTREAYRGIGGVAGALAQHAEATLERIGTHRTPLVRELFRNLVTAQGTRAARERGELLSVFPEENRADAGEVLGALVDARLLTSFERPGDEAGESRHEIEIVHESLLSRWPRLVRWQTQDADGAQLRDQLRQAAQAWQDRGRAEDLLWSGTAYRDLSVWRERYSGGLSATEEAFARAAQKHAGRRRRRRRWALAAAVTIAAVVATTTSVLWRQADAEARRAEAAELLALGRLELEDRPTTGLAYVLASLERADTPAARRFAVETLAHGASAFILPGDTQFVDFSRDGRWLAAGGTVGGVRLWSREGGPPVSLASSVGIPSVEFDPRGTSLLIRDNEAVRIFSVVEAPDFRQVHAEDIREEDWWHVPRESRLFRLTRGPRGSTVYAQPIGEGEPRLLGRWDSTDVPFWRLSSTGARLAYARGRQLFLRFVEDLNAPPRLVGEHDAPVRQVIFAPGDDRLISADEPGEIRIWSMAEGVWTLERTIRSGLTRPFALIDRSGSTLVAGWGGLHESPEPRVWDLKGPPDAEPRLLRNGDLMQTHMGVIDPSGRWLATAHDVAVLWPLGGRNARVIRGQAPPAIQVAFTPDGKWLASTSAEKVVRLWPLSPTVAPERRVLVRGGLAGLINLAVDPASRNILVVAYGAVELGPGPALLVPLDGGAPRNLRRSAPSWLDRPAFSRDGRLAAAGTRNRPGGNLIEVWDLPSGAVRTLDPRPAKGEKECGSGPHTESAVYDVAFTSDGRLLSAGLSGLRLWNLDDGTNTLLRSCPDGGGPPFLGASREDRYLLVESGRREGTSGLSLLDLRGGVSRELKSHGNGVWSVALDPRGEIAVTGGGDGVVRVGPVTDEEPHLLYGHDGGVGSVAVSPDGRWIASGSNDGTIRLWPMPKGRPFHTLPYDELLTRLRSFTNFRVVRDDAAETGYSVEYGPFPGWAVMPEW
jgi:WD40 repeat protein